MAKRIKVTENDILDLCNSFKEALKKIKASDGKFTFSKDISSVEKKAKLLFTQKAWDKMWALIDGYSTEVGWHGIAERGEDDTYYIKDILVYPQEVTGVTVVTDQEKYQMWLVDRDDEEFNSIRMQGHSHVNMGVTPSGVDETLYRGILDQLGDDMFYIFMIWNKKKDKTIKIYDMKKNVLFDTKDIEVEMIDEEYIVSGEPETEEEIKAVRDFLCEYRKKKMTDGFLSASKELVDKPAASAVTPTKSVMYERDWEEWYGDYYGKGYGYSPYSQPKTNTVSENKTASDAPKAESKKILKRKESKS